MTLEARSLADESIAARLRAVDGPGALHSLLSQLAESPDARWTRTQVLYYLPARWRATAAPYFDEETLRAPGKIPEPPAPVDVVQLDRALAEVAALPPVERAAPLSQRRVPSAGELLDTQESAPSSDVDRLFSALREEIAAVNSAAPKRFRLSDGECVDAPDGQFEYTFRWSSEPELQQPGELRIGKIRCQARVTRQSTSAEKAYAIAVPDYLGPSIPSAEFVVDPTYLLRVLHRELAEWRATGNRVERALERLLHPESVVLPEPGQTDAGSGELNDHQRRAILLASHAATSYVWGPPGTGKTHTIGALVAHLVKSGKRVLVVSPYNVAVDEAMSAVWEASPASLRESGIVRFGRVSEKMRKKGLHMDALLERLAARDGTLAAARRLVASIHASRGGQDTPPASVRSCLDELGRFVVRRRAAARDPVNQRVMEAISALRTRFRAPEPAIMQDARVVGCTVSLAFVSPLVFARPFDHLIVDEASVLRTPEAVALLARVDAPVTFFGDPEQLTSIVHSRSALSRAWLAASPFEMIARGRENGQAGAIDTRVMLREQHRMAPSICELVSKLSYGGQLTQGKRAPVSGQVLVLDTSKTAARATSRMVRLSHSRENLVHRSVIAAALRELLERDPGKQVLVLSPFIAQTRAYRREAVTARLQAEGVRFETIHSSQGAQADTVIIDFVIAGEPGGRGTRSRMFSEDTSRAVRNLVNVAISRAKHRLLLVAHLDCIRHGYSQGVLHRVISEASRAGRREVVPADMLLERFMASHIAE